MRKIIIGVTMTCFIVIGIVILMTLDGRNIRESEVYDSLTTAVESSMQTLMIDNTYTIQNTDEFVADFLEALMTQIESDSDISVNVIDVDVNKGLLSVEVVEEYTHPNRSKGSVSCVKTVILEKDAKKDNNTKSFFSITYYVRENKDTEAVVYKQYTVEKNSKIIIPTEPSMNGKTFLYWMERNGEKYSFLNADGSKKNVSGDIELTAVFAD